MSISRNIGRDRKRHSYDQPVYRCGEWRRSIKITVPEFELKCTTAWPPRTKLFDLGECTTLQRVIASNDRSESKSRPALWHFRIKRNYKSTTCLSRCHLDGSFPLLFTINPRSFRFFPRHTYTYTYSHDIRDSFVSPASRFRNHRGTGVSVRGIRAFVNGVLPLNSWDRRLSSWRRTAHPENISRDTHSTTLCGNVRTMRFFETSTVHSSGCREVWLRADEVEASPNFQRRICRWEGAIVRVNVAQTVFRFLQRQPSIEVLETRRPLAVLESNSKLAKRSNKGETKKSLEKKIN